MKRLSLEKRKARDAAFAALLRGERPEDALRQAMIAARTRAGLSQRELARRMRTSQSVLARLELGICVPNMKTLLRLAEATGSRLVVNLVWDELSSGGNLGDKGV